MITHFVQIDEYTWVLPLSISLIEWDGFSYILTINNTKVKVSVSYADNISRLLNECHFGRFVLEDEAVP